MVGHPVVYRYKGLLNHVEILKGQVAFFKFPFGQTALNQAVNPCRHFSLGKGTHALKGGLNGIGHHHNGAFSCLRLGEGIGIILCPGFGIQFLGFMIKIFDNAVAVVFGNDVYHVFGQTVFLGHFNAVLHVGNDNQRGEGRRNLIVGVDALILIFRKIGRSFQLADIVIIGSYPHQKGIGANGIGGGLGQVGYEDAMVVSPRGFGHEPFDQRVSRGGKLHQFHRCGQLQAVFQQGNTA